jgi:hypothetical protein
MGVSREDYIVYGWKLPYEFVDIDDLYMDDKYLPYVEGSPDVTPYIIVSDGMSGNYMVFGKQILQSEDYEGFDFQELDLFDHSSQQVKEEFIKVFDKEPEGEPKFLIFSHFH